MSNSQPRSLGGARSFLILSLAFHIAFLSSIFDIYFVSPVVPVENTYGVEDGGLADRVVLIVGKAECSQISRFKIDFRIFR
jgi:hypothetical protein